MQYHMEAEPVYFHILQGSPFLLADERCKKKLLDIVFDQYRRLGWRLYAFCVTDSVVYLLSVTAGRSFKEEYLQLSADTFLFWESGQKNIYAGSSTYLKSRMIRVLSDMDIVIKHCCQIHQIPLAAGYVEHMEDYWWSSYHTYQDSYMWSMIDCHAVFFYFSANSVLARKRFRSFHDFVELPVLNRTESENKNDAELRLLNENIGFS